MEKINFWKDKRIVITGGEGFLGRVLTRKIREKNPRELRVISKESYDLRKYWDCLRATKDSDIVIHLAAKVGGIGFNQEKPGELFYDNLLIGAQTMEASRINNVEKFVAIGTICAYPKFTPVPFKEEDLWSGYPEETNAPYGLAKKMLLVQSQSYRFQYGFNSIFLLPVNLYGPGDNFDPKSSHVIPALIRKMIEAKRNNNLSIEIWGTGKSSREFLYVEDCAEAIILATEKYNLSEPVNIGSGMEITIKDLAEKLKNLTNFNGEIIWNKDKPDGQPRRCLDISKAKEKFGFVATTNFNEGLKKTIEYFKDTFY